MYVYLITNQINNKKYVGITNDYKKRWANHKCNNDPNMAIAKAIKKYGAENFKFEILKSGLTIEEASEEEIRLIKELNTNIVNGQGYNIALGGMSVTDNPQKGEKNGRALLTDQEVQYLKDHRDQPMYVLYDDFSDKISYAEFKEIYKDKKWKHIKTKTPQYPYNFEFSNQFSSLNKLNYDEVVELRQQYANNVFWKKAYTEKYQKLFNDEMTFWNIYVGNRYKLVMPEVFTPERKHFQSSFSHSGASNGRSKLSLEQVKQMRYDFENKIKTRKEIQEEYKQVSTSAINNILAYRTWKYD